MLKFKEKPALAKMLLGFLRNCRADSFRLGFVLSSPHLNPCSRLRGQSAGRPGAGVRDTR